MYDLHFTTHGLQKKINIQSFIWICDMEFIHISDKKYCRVVNGFAPLFNGLFAIASVQFPALVVNLAFSIKLA